MNQKRLGVFPLGHENVELVAILDDGGGAFYFAPDRESPGRIKVGLGYKHWDQVVATLLHETMEYAMDRHKLRYEKTQNLCNDHAGYLFVMDHCAFSEVCACVASFVVPALPKLADVFRHRRKAGRA